MGVRVLRVPAANVLRTACLCDLSYVFTAITVVTLICAFRRSIRQQTMCSYSHFGIDVSRTPDSEGWFTLGWGRDQERALIYRARVQQSTELELKSIVHTPNGGRAYEVWLIRLVQPSH